MYSIKKIEQNVLPLIKSRAGGRSTGTKSRCILALEGHDTVGELTSSVAPIYTEITNLFGVEANA